MKNIILFSLALSFIMIVQAQSVGIGTITPAISAQLDINSTTKDYYHPE